jgi:glutamine---fructose-6-phosphate transaminase (isomerizing)
MAQAHLMLENILSLAKPETWQSSIGLAEFTSNHWLKKVGEVDFERVYLVGCGTSLYNGQVAKYAFEQIAGLAAEAIPAFTFSKYAQRNLLNPRTLVVGISTTGGTEAVCEALGTARRAGARALAVTAEADSAVARMAEAAILTNGQHDKMSVKTSSYVQALIALYVLATRLRARRASTELNRSSTTQSGSQVKDWIFEISKAGELAARFLDRQREEIRLLAQQFGTSEMVFVLGSGPNLGTAEEAALKVIEMAKMHAEAQELENFLHGRLREVDQENPLFFMAPKGAASARLLDFLTVTDYIKAPSVVLSDDPTEGIQKLATHIIQMPGEIDELVTPLLYIIPMYLFGYEMALKRGYDPNVRRYPIVPQKVRYGQPIADINHPAATNQPIESNH